MLAELILRNGEKLYELLVRGVMRAPTVFFDVTSMGRVMNRLQHCMQTFIILLTDIIGLCFIIGINMPYFFPAAHAHGLLLLGCRLWKPQI